MSGIENQYTNRVLNKINQMINYPLTLLVSPPGFGKSQLLQEYIKQANNTVFFITLEKKHRYVKEFIAYLTSTLHKTFPKINWDDVNQSIYPSILFDEETANKWLNQLKIIIESVDQPVIIIIENYDLIEEESFIYRLFHRFISMLPPNLHVLITSCHFPSGEAFQMAELQNRLLEINEQDFRLSPHEIKTLFADEYHLPITDKEVEDLYALTMGWKMALHAAFLYISRGGKVEQIVSDPLLTLPSFFTFLEEELIKALPTFMQGFLYEISIFEEIDLEVLNYLYRNNGLEMLAIIEKHRILLHSDVTSRKKLHPMIKLFLLSKLDKNALKQLHRRVSYYYLNRSDYPASIPFLIGVQEWEELAYLVSTLGSKLIYFGHIKIVMDAIQALPSSYKSAFPRTLIVEGDYYRLHSEYNTALEKYQSAYQVCQNQADEEGALLAVEGEVRIYLDTVKPNKAYHLLKRTYQKYQLSSEWKLRLIHLMAENYINIGKPRRTNFLLRLGQKLSNGQMIEVRESRLLLRTGQLPALDTLLQKEELKTKEETPLIHGFRETSLVHSLVASFMGQADIAKKRAQQGILLGTQLKSPFIEATGWARMGHAMQIVDPHNFKLSEECYLTSLQIFEEIGLEWGQAEPLMGLSLLHGKSGNYDLAITYGTEACRIASGVTDYWMYHLSQLCMGIASYLAGKFDEALSIFTEALTGIRKCGDQFLESIILLWTSYAHYQLENEEKTYRYFTMSIASIAKNSFDFVFLKHSMFGHRDIQINVPLLLEVQQQRGTNHAYATKILQELGFSHTKFHPGYTLKIETLGGFRVWLGDREVLEKDWQRVNAKRLFQYLITKRKQEVPKEIIQTVLWPELDEDSLDRDFKVALNALTKALEPDRKARSSSFYVIRNGSTYRLNPDSGYYLDVDMFEKLYEEGIREKDLEKAKSKLEMGFSLYSGDFLADNLYEDWAIEERERLQVLYLRGSERYAYLLLRFKDYEQSIKVAGTIIDKDPCWEEAYRIIMFAYAKLKNRTLALRWYEKCKQNLFDELGIEPMLITRKLKEQIQNGIELELDLLK